MNLSSGGNSSKDVAGKQGKVNGDRVMWFWLSNRRMLACLWRHIRKISLNICSAGATERCRYGHILVIYVTKMCPKCAQIVPKTWSLVQFVTKRCLKYGHMAKKWPKKWPKFGHLSKMLPKIGHLAKMWPKKCPKYAQSLDTFSKCDQTICPRFSQYCKTVKSM